MVDVNTVAQQQHEDELTGHKMRGDRWREAAFAFELRAMRVEYVLRLLVAAGHVTQAKVDEAFNIARDFKRKDGPASPDTSVAGEMGGNAHQRAVAMYLLLREVSEAGLLQEGSELTRRVNMELNDHEAADGAQGLKTSAVVSQNTANVEGNANGVPAAVPLPRWEPCNEGCDPEFNGFRTRHCDCPQARAALGVEAQCQECAIQPCDRCPDGVTEVPRG